MQALCLKQAFKNKLYQNLEKVSKISQKKEIIII